jgi:hypothetical protein
MPMYGQFVAGSTTTDTVSIAARSERSCTYLTQPQLAFAVEATAVQMSKAKSVGMNGVQVEELIADVKGGQRPGGDSSRPVSDIWIDGTGYSIKTLQLKPASCRPHWQDWLLQSVSIPTTRRLPLGALPKGKTLDTARPADIGKRLIARLNDDYQTFAIERQGFLLLLRVEAEQLTRFYYWEQAIEPLDPSAYKWSVSERSMDNPYKRNLRADLKESKQDAAAMTWNRVLWVRHQIPADADTWVVPDCQVLTRDEASDAISLAIRDKMRAGR